MQQVQPGQAPQTSIHSLKQRLAPYGFQQRCDGILDNYNDKLCMDNLFARHWKDSFDEHSMSHYDSCFLELDPGPMPLPPLPTQQRVQPVTVVHCNGSKAPVTYGIPIDWHGSNQQLMDGVRKQCGLPEDKQIVLVQLDRNLFWQVKMFSGCVATVLNGAYCSSSHDSHAAAVPCYGLPGSCHNVIKQLVSAACCCYQPHRN